MHDVRGPAGDSPVTLINVFEVPAGHVDEFIAGWRERAALMSTKPGFRDTRLHRALSAQSRFPLVNVAHWESRAALHAAQADPGFQELIKAATTDPRAPVSANPAVYEIAVEFSSPTPPDTAAPRPSTGPALPAHRGGCPCGVPATTAGWNAGGRGDSSGSTLLPPPTVRWPLEPS